MGYFMAKNGFVADVTFEIFKKAFFIVFLNFYFRNRCYYNSFVNFFKNLVLSK